MPSGRFTEQFLARVRTADRAEYRDYRYPGLRLRVSASGHRSWSFVYRFRGRLTRLSLGPATALGVADAIRLSKRAALAVAEGHDPARINAREGRTVAALFEEYRAVAARKKGWPEEQRILRREILPHLSHRLVSEISRADLHDLTKRKVASAPVMANRVLARVCRLLSFAVEIGWLDANPALRFPKPFRERSRDHVLVGVELQAVCRGLSAIAKNPNHLRGDRQAARAMSLILLTAQRPGEVSGSEISAFDFSAHIWTISAAAAKNGHRHLVPLSPAAVHIVQDACADAGGEFVFSTGGRASIRARFRKAALRFHRRFGMPKFTCHDLRRTSATVLASEGVPRQHIAHLLNHRSATHGDVTAIYDRHDYRNEKIAAAAVLERVMTGHGLV